MKRMLHIFIVALLPAVSALAGTITMEVKCAIQGSNLIVQVLNKGDEAARNVGARIVFNRTEIETAPLPELPPASPRGVPVGLSLEGLRGTYPAIVTVNFEDANGYPFSTVSVIMVPAEDAKHSDVMGALDVTRIRGKTEVPLRLRSSVEEPVTVHYRLILPRELSAENATGEITVPSGGQSMVPLVFENFSALPNSRYGLHAVLEYEAGGRHYTSVASGSVQVIPPRGGKAWYFWVAAAVVMIAIVISFIPRRPKLAAG